MRTSMHLDRHQHSARHQHGDIDPRDRWGLLERLYDWSRTGADQSRGEMLSLLVDRLGLDGAALVALETAPPLGVLEARGETAELVRAPWLLERMMAPGREGCGELHHHHDAVLATMRPPSGGVFGLVAGGLWPGWDPSILRLALRFLSPAGLRPPTPAETLVDRAVQGRRSETLAWPVEADPAASDLDLRWHTANLERHLLQQALRRSHGNLSEAARLAGISRARLRRRLSALGLR